MIPSIITRRLAILSLGCSIVAVATPLRAADSIGVRATIEALEKKYDEAFNKGDAKTLASLYLDNAQLLAPDVEIVKGKKAIEMYWKGEMTSAAAAGTKNSSTPIEIEDHGQVVHETGRWVTATPDGNIVEEGKYLVIWKKQAGQWKIHRETWNVKRGAAKK